MKTAFDRVLGKARARCLLNLFLEQLARTLLAAGLAGAAAVAAERVFSLGLFHAWMLGALAGLAVLAAGILWLVRLPDRMHIAILLDQKLGLRERFSTALALASSTDPFAVAARAETHELAGRLSLRKEFQLRPDPPLVEFDGVLGRDGRLALFLPTYDLLGHGRDRQEKEDAARQLAQAKEQVKQTMEKVSTSVRLLNDPEAAGELAKLAQATDAAKPEEVKRDAIRKLEELAEKVEHKLSLPKLEGARDLKDMLKGMRGTPDVFSRELGQAVAKADFKQAADILKQIQKNLDEGKLTQEQKDKLAKQLNEMGQQLKDLAQKKTGLEDELQKQGLPKDLAKLDPEKLKEALDKQGLSEDKVKDLVDKAEAAQKAGEACKNLGEKMCDAGNQGQGNQLSDKELSDLADSLSDLEATEQELAQAEAALADIQRGMAGLGQAQPNGDLEGDQGGLGQYGEGEPGLVPQPGTGKPGLGYGARPTDMSGATALEKTLAQSKTNEGPAVASWYFKGPQAKGEATKQLQQVIQAAKDTAAEAINENEIPRKYEGPVKKYFGELEESNKPK